VIIRDLEVYSPSRAAYVWVEAIIDTGASVCVVPAHIASALSLTLGPNVRHLWQVRDPLTLHQAALKVRYNNRPYDVDATVVDIPPAFRRIATPAEHCTQPQAPHPLTQRIIIGENFLGQLPPGERQAILLLE
jgi:hypothetical protein